MNIHELYKKDVQNSDKVQYNRGGRGEFYGGDQIYTTGFRETIIPFSGKAYKLNDELVIDGKKPKSCFQWFKEKIGSIINYLYIG